LEVYAMKIARLLLIALTAAASTWLILSPPSAAAAGCPHVEVVFARGTGEPPGVGGVGQQFIDALSHKIGHVGVYPVDYPASMDFGGSTVAGVTDAGHHIQYTAHNCPGTRIILGGYSQGAAVAGFTTAAAVPPGIDVGDLQVMNPNIANHVAAVVLFGTPSDQFLGMIGQPPLTIGPLYAGKTTQLCTDGDPVCSGAGIGGDWAQHDAYGGGKIDDGATYAAWRI
jgi:hypothetical protein